jgi:hypothetical protein
MNNTTMIKRLDRHMEKIATERDALRDFLVEIETLIDPMNRAVEAIVALSEQV